MRRKKQRWFIYNTHTGCDFPSKTPGFPKVSAVSAEPEHQILTCFFRQAGSTVPTTLLAETINSFVLLYSSSLSQLSFCTSEFSVIVLKLHVSFTVSNCVTTAFTERNWKSKSVSSDNVPVGGLPPLCPRWEFCFCHSSSSLKTPRATAFNEHICAGVVKRKSDMGQNTLQDNNGGFFCNWKSTKGLEIKN